MENKTKKQQEWRELVAKTKDEELYKTPTGYLIEHIEIWDGAKMVGGAFSISNEIISQLLSEEYERGMSFTKTVSEVSDKLEERTFTKEEGRVLRWLIRNNEKEIDIDSFEKKLRHAIVSEFDSVSEFNKEKKEILELAKNLNKKQEKEYEILLRKLKYRKDIEKQSEEGLRKHLGAQNFDSDDIEEYIRKMIRKDYKNLADIKRDRETLDYMVNTYKKNDEEDANRNLEEIKFLFDRMESRLSDIESDLRFDNE